MKQLLLLLSLILSTTTFGQRFLYDVTYEGSDGDSLMKTEGTFEISRVRKSNFVFHKGVLKIKTDNLNVRKKIVFFYNSDGDDTFFDISFKPEDLNFDRIIGMPVTMSFFLNDKTVYYIQMVPQKKGS